MVPFTYDAVQSEQEARSAAAAGARFLAGGTTLVDLMREEVERPESLIDINQLPLRDIQMESGGLIIGALARMAEVAAHPLVTREQPLIAEALLEGASPQLRNMASIGGNLMQRVRCPYFRTLDAACNKRQPGSGCAAIEGLNNTHAILGASEHCVATHPSDLAVALVALDAVLRVRRDAGLREFPVEDLYRLPGDTPHIEHMIEPGELIVEVVVPRGAYARRARYVKVRDRASYEFALVSVAAALEIDDEQIRSVRLAAGGVGTKPWRLRASEAAIMGERAGRKAWELAASRAIEGARPLSGNGYKVELLRRTVIRALELSAEIAGETR
jgi:xanthine dehydrogenase YagS FAD-binding subunit